MDDRERLAHIVSAPPIWQEGWTRPELQKQLQAGAYALADEIIQCGFSSTTARRAALSDKHPEAYCHRCFGNNLSWFINSETWNKVMRPNNDGTWLWNEIICPSCFAELYEERFGLAAFELSVEQAKESKEELMMRFHIHERDYLIRQMAKMDRKNPLNRIGRYASRMLNQRDRRRNLS